MSDADERWVTCAAYLDWKTAQYVHLVRRGPLDTRCGASASHADVWRANRKKPKCPECLEAR